VALYARVSSSENKDNLERQAERLISWCNAQGWSMDKVVKGCGSGINDQRPKFLALLADPKVGQIVVEHKERSSLPLWRGVYRNVTRHAGAGIGAGEHC
jgi:putative resolvase